MKLVYFSATWCAPCRFFGPIIKEWAHENSVNVDKVDVSEQSAMAAKMDIKSVPTLVAEEGGVEKGRIRGAQSKKELTKWFNNL